MAENKMTRRTFIKTTGLMALGASTLGFPAIVRSTSKLEEVPIALVIPMTGPLGSFGQNELRGWTIAVEEINAAGGIKSLGGAKLKGEIRDTQGKPRIGMAEVEKVARNKQVPLMVGCWNSSVTYPASQVSEQYSLPHIIDIGSQTNILRRGFKYVFRYINSTEETCRQMVRFAREVGEKTGRVPKRAALIARDDGYGKEVCEALRKGLEESGQEIVAHIYYPTKVTNVDVEISKIKAAKPDVIYPTTFLNDGVLITKALRNQNVQALGYVFGGGINQPKYLEMAGDLAQYFFMQNNIDQDLSRPMDKEFQRKIKERYNVNTNQFSAALYGIAYLIKDVLERAGTVDREKVRDAIAATNISTGKALMVSPRGVRYDERGENLGAATFVCQCSEKAWHTVWPFDWEGKHDIVWPMPKWQS
jgi:branched-chain amino acid transport system substrate-binding protein